MQAPQDTKRVRFLGWDRSRRSNEMDLLADISFKEGIIIFQEDENFLIEWDSGERSFHFTTEFEEIKPFQAGSKYWEEVSKPEYLANWLTTKGFKSFKREDGTLYFLSPRGKTIEAAQIKQFMAQDIYSHIYYDRMALLAGMDNDYASSNNGVGFSKHDTEAGHSLFDFKKTKGFWTEQQLKFAVRLLHKYRMQIMRVQGEKFIPVVEFKNLNWGEEMNQFLDHQS